MNLEFFNISPEELKEIEKETLRSLIVSCKNNTHDTHLIKTSHFILEKVRNILIEYKFPDNSLNGSCVMEYHSYLSTSDEKTIESSLPFHIDDENGFNRCNSCIFYFENTFKRGGELVIERNNENEIIDTRKFNCVLMTGKVSHGVLPCHGKGKRRCIVIHIHDNAEE